MKRIALLLGLAIILTTCAQAATAPAKAAAPAPAAAKTKMYVGVQSSAVTVAPAVTVNLTGPFIGFQINPDMSVDVGLALTTTSPAGGASTSTFGLLGRFNSALAEISKVKVGWGAELVIMSTNAGGPSTTAFLLSGLLSAEYMITDSLSVFGNAYLLRFGSASTGGTSSTAIMLLTSDPLAYTGFRVYL